MTTTVSNLSLNEIRVRGHAALLRELGPTGYVQFIRQFQPGRGDYTAERRERVDRTSVDALFDALDQWRARSGPGAVERASSMAGVKVLPTGHDSIIAYGVEHLGGEPVLAEYRSQTAPFHCPRAVYDAVAKTLQNHAQGLVVRELMGLVELIVGHPVPEYQVRVALRLWQRLDTPLVVRDKGVYRPANGVELVRSSAVVWESLPVDKPSAAVDRTAGETAVDPDAVDS